MEEPKNETTRLRTLRKRAGMTMREVAERVGTNHQTVLYWEKVGKVGNAELIMPLAEALGVTVEEILGYPRPRKTVPVGGRMGEVFEAASRLPRRQQQKILDIVEPFIREQKTASTQ